MTSSGDGKSLLAQALVKAQATFHAAKKDSLNPHFKSNYADLSSVIDAIKGAFAANNLAFLQPVTWDQGVYFIETVILHASGESMSLGKIRVPLSDTDSQNAQKLGSAITYMRRYHLSSAVGVSQEDDDGNAASARPPAPAPTPRAQSAGPDVPPSPNQLSYIKKMADELGMQAPQVTTAVHASRVIDDLMKAKVAGRGAR